MQELETRILDIDVDNIRNILKNIGCENVKSEDQINKLFDFPDRSMLNKKGYARVRTVNDRLNNKTVYYMTTKKMLSQEKFKVMEENETIVESGETAEKIFYSLGLVLVETINKYRESYQYKNSLIEIDINDPSFCPFPYLEIETNSEEELNEIVTLLGYTINDTSSKTIYEILKERGFSPSNDKKGV